MMPHLRYLSISVEENDFNSNDEVNTLDDIMGALRQLILSPTRPKHITLIKPANEYVSLREIHDFVEGSLCLSYHGLWLMLDLFSVTRCRASRSRENYV